MDVEAILKAYYWEGSRAFAVIFNHSEAVAQKALDIVAQNDLRDVDTAFIYEAAMLHDIGIFYTHAPDLECYGSLPYICHGYKGSELLEQLGHPKHALVCERHTGAGLSKEAIVSQNLPIPHRDMLPVSLEEQIICFADKFFSKSGELRQEKSVKKIRKSMLKYGQEQLNQFDQWCNRYL